MNKLHINLNIDPPTVTAQQKKIRIVNGRPIFYYPNDVKRAKQLLYANLLIQRPQEPFECPVELRTIWRFRPGKTHKNNEWRSTKPDTDNLQKLLKDCMTDTGYWKDDALVVKETVEKYWSDTPGIEIEITALMHLRED